MKESNLKFKFSLCLSQEYNPNQFLLYFILKQMSSTSLCGAIKVSRRVTCVTCFWLAGWPGDGVWSYHALWSPGAFSQHDLNYGNSYTIICKVLCVHTFWLLRWLLYNCMCNGWTMLPSSAISLDGNQRLVFWRLAVLVHLSPSVVVWKLFSIQYGVGFTIIYYFSRK